jgi:hypothetical protein
MSHSCPRFSDCNAPLCPIIPSPRHLRGESICSYMLEAVKPNGPERLAKELSAGLVEQILTFIPKASKRSGDIARRLRRAAIQGSKIESGKLLKARSVVSRCEVRRARETAK